MWYDNKLAEDLKELTIRLEDFGIKPFLWAGTLLGSVREGSFIKKDNDVDLAYISEKTNPKEVMEEAINLYRKLEEAGLLLDYYDEDWKKRDNKKIQSAFGQCHIFINKSSNRGFTADLFTTWVEGDNFYDPWFGNIGKKEDFVFKRDCSSLDGVTFNGLERPEVLLNVLYGKDWKKPKQEKGTKRNKFRKALKESIKAMV